MGFIPRGTSIHDCCELPGASAAGQQCQQYESAKHGNGSLNLILCRIAFVADAASDEPQRPNQRPHNESHVMAFRIHGREHSIEKVGAWLKECFNPIGSP